LLNTGIIVASLVLLCLMWLVSRSASGHAQTSKWLEAALTNIGDAVLTTDERGGVTALNDVAERLTEWTSAAAHGRNSTEILRIVDHDTRAVAEDPIQKALSTGKISGWAKNAILISRGGSERPIDSCAAPVSSRSGSIRGAILIFRDISDRYTSEQRLLESEERLKAVTNAARIGLVMIDRDRRYVYANNFYMQMLDISDAKLIGKKVIDVLPVVYEQIRPNLDRAFAGERLSYEVKGLKDKEKGLNRIYSVTYEPQLRQSLVMHVVIVVLDITEIKKAGETLKAGNG
jgi:PAS domain S-box-containing protein